MSASEGVFEKDGTLSFTPLKDETGESVAADSIVSARLYKDAPSDAQKEDTDNTSPGDALQYITSWTSGDDLHEQLIAYTQITDDDAGSSIDYAIYYWVISYKLDSGGATINDVIRWTIRRVKGSTSTVDVFPKDIYGIESKLEDVFSTKVELKIKLAVTLVNKHLIASGYDIRRIRLSDVKELYIYKTAVLCCGDLSNRPGDEWREKKEDHQNAYNMLFDTIKIGYDVDDDSDIEPGERVDQSIHAFIR